MIITTNYKLTSVKRALPNLKLPKIHDDIWYLQFEGEWQRKWHPSLWHFIQFLSKYQIDTWWKCIKRRHLELTYLSKSSSADHQDFREQIGLRYQTPSIFLLQLWNTSFSQPWYFWFPGPWTRHLNDEMLQWRPTWEEWSMGTCNENSQIHPSGKPNKGFDHSLMTKLKKLPFGK
jgi:hypothetical protein